MGLFSFLNKSKQDADDDIDVPVKPRRRARAQEEEPLDPMLPEKKRARRRLIGATALVLAAVIGLPMIFDSEPKPLNDDIAIQIPSRDKSGAPVHVGSAPAASELAEAPRAAPPAARTETPMTEKLPSAEAVKPGAEKPAEKHPEKHPEKAADKSSEKAAEKPAADKSAEKASADKEKSVADKSKSSRFILQVAAVANKTKAEELQNRLKQAGIKSYSQKTSTKDGERYRIRVGPFASREEADKMRARLSKMGLSATVQPV